MDDTCCCKLNIEHLSEGWKKDSLTSGGFRLANYKKLMSCKIDSVSIDFLVKMLGEPASRGISKKEISLIYYFFDRNTISKKNLEDIIGITFTFERNNNQLISKDLMLYDF